MKPLRKMTGAALIAILLTHSLFTNVRGQMSRGPVHIKGTILCAGCAIDELRKRRFSQHQLSQLTHAQGQVVLEVRTVNDTPSWRPASWPGEVQVRAREELFRRLTAEENLFKEVEIIGLFSTTRALDIFDVKVST
jgi:hypothetical protein